METQTISPTIIEAPPSIENTPARANETVMHYGYVAFQDIELTGAGGQERYVQPADSPYYRKLPARRLIPFTNVTEPKIDESKARTKLPNKSVVPVSLHNKTARACAEEMRDAYQAWGFTVLDGLTGFDNQTAFRIFQTIHPFDYLLIDMVNELEYNAIERIEKDEDYTVEYAGASIDLEPLTPTEKEIAKKVLGQMQTAARIAFDLAEDRREATTQSLTSFFAGQGGKRRPDPLDRYIFAQLKAKMPELVRPEQQEARATGVDADALGKAIGEAITQNKNATALESAMIERLEQLEAKLAQYEAVPQPTEDIEPKGAKK